MDRDDHLSGSQLWQGLPQTTHSSLTPAGEIEQATKVAEGFKRPRSGWQRTVFRAGVVVLALCAAFMVFAAFYGAAHQ
jgi:hypothetical protein